LLTPSEQTLWDNLVVHVAC